QRRPDPRLLDPLGPPRVHDAPGRLRELLRPRGRRGRVHLPAGRGDVGLPLLAARLRGGAGGPRALRAGRAGRPARAGPPPIRCPRMSAPARARRARAGGRPPRGPRRPRRTPPQRTPPHAAARPRPPGGPERTIVE